MDGFPKEGEACRLGLSALPWLRATDRYSQIGMKHQGIQRQAESGVADLYPRLRPEELEEAELNLKRYVALALRVYERIQSDPESYARLRSLTVARKRSTISNTAPSPRTEARPLPPQ